MSGGKSWRHYGHAWPLSSEHGSWLWCDNWAVGKYHLIHSFSPVVPAPPPERHKPRSRGPEGGLSGISQVPLKGGLGVVKTHF